MRTKACDGVLRVEISRLDVKPEFVVYYSGLIGISQRPILRDLVEGLLRMGMEKYLQALDAIRRRGAADVSVYYTDYVSYGIGGGDATGEFYFGQLLLLHEPASKRGHERLELLRPTLSAKEVLELEGLEEGVSEPPESVTLPVQE